MKYIALIFIIFCLPHYGISQQVVLLSESTLYAEYPQTFNELKKFSTEDELELLDKKIVGSKRKANLCGTLSLIGLAAVGIASIPRDNKSNGSAIGQLSAILVGGFSGALFGTIGFVQLSKSNKYKKQKQALLESSELGQAPKPINFNIGITSHGLGLVVAF